MHRLLQVALVLASCGVNCAALARDAADSDSSRSTPAARTDLSHKLAADSELAAPVSHDLQLLLAIAALRASPTHAARANLLSALNQSPTLSKMLWGQVFFPETSLGVSNVCQREIDGALRLG